MTAKKVDPWQLTLRGIRNEKVERVGTYLDRLDDLIKGKKKGKPIDKNEIEAIKLALDVLGARKDEKPERLEKLKKKKEVKTDGGIKVNKKFEKEAEDFYKKWTKQNTSSQNSSA